MFSFVCSLILLLESNVITSSELLGKGHRSRSTLLSQRRVDCLVAKAFNPLSDVVLFRA